jgi:hypothetical protein
MLRLRSTVLVKFKPIAGFIVSAIEMRSFFVIFVVIIYMYHVSWTVQTETSKRGEPQNICELNTFQNPSWTYLSVLFRKNGVDDFPLLLVENATLITFSSTILGHQIFRLLKTLWLEIILAPQTLRMEKLMTGRPQRGTE